MLILAGRTKQKYATQHGNNYNKEEEEEMREKQRGKVRTVQATGNLRTTRQIICTIRTIQHYNCMIPGSISQTGQSKFEQQQQKVSEIIMSVPVIRLKQGRIS